MAQLTVCMVVQMPLQGRMFASTGLKVLSGCTLPYTIGICEIMAASYLQVTTLYTYSTSSISSWNVPNILSKIHRVPP